MVHIEEVKLLMLVMSAYKSVSKLLWFCNYELCHEPSLSSAIERSWCVKPRLTRRAMLQGENRYMRSIFETRCTGSTSEEARPRGGISEETYRRGCLQGRQKNLAVRTVPQKRLATRALLQNRLTTEAVFRQRLATWQRIKEKLPARAAFEREAHRKRS
jgi:hypothetical protein